MGWKGSGLEARLPAFPSHQPPVVTPSQHQIRLVIEAGINFLDMEEHTVYTPTGMRVGVCAGDRKEVVLTSASCSITWFD